MAAFQGLQSEAQQTITGPIGGVVLGNLNSNVSSAINSLVNAAQNYHDDNLAARTCLYNQIMGSGEDCSGISSAATGDQASLLAAAQQALSYLQSAQQANNGFAQSNP